MDKPGAAQSIVSAALVGAARTTPDYAVLEVLNTALGGQFTSRLNLNLREAKGYTYGARSRFGYGSVPGSFLATAPVQTAVTADAIHEMLRDLADVGGARPLTAVEAAYAADSMVNGYARRFETAGRVARELVEVELYGLPGDALETFPAQVRAVKPEDLTAAARKYILSDRLAIVVVGDLAVIRPAIEKLGLGPVVVMDAKAL